MVVNYSNSKEKISKRITHRVESSFDPTPKQQLVILYLGFSTSGLLGFWRDVLLRVQSILQDRTVRQCNVPNPYDKEKGSKFRFKIN